MENKKYYWLKLKEDFFEDKQIKYLNSLPDGDKLVVAYLKMQLKSLKTEGFIKYDSILPSNVEELSMILDVDVNIVKLLISALQQVKAVEILDDGSFYMIAMQDLIGKEGASAERVRQFRERKKRELLQCNTNVTKRNTEIEKDIEKDIDIYNITPQNCFEKFWKAYPRKQDKGRVEKWFKQHKPSEETVDLMIKQIERFKQTEQWKKEDGKYIPYPSTWLNAKSWEDEFETEQEKEDRMFREIEEKYKEG